MLLLALKALHIIAFVAWFAGLFYLIRIFVYHVEAFAKPEPEQSILVKQFELMELRVYSIIATPAMVATWVFGISMIVLYGWDWFRSAHWLHLKLALLFGLTGFHFYCKKIKDQLGFGSQQYTSFKMRLINEVPTLFLFSIVLLAVLKSLSNFGILITAIFALGVVLYFATKFYKRYRLRNNN